MPIVGTGRCAPRRVISKLSRRDRFALRSARTGTGIYVVREHTADKKPAKPKRYRTGEMPVPSSSAEGTSPALWGRRIPGRKLPRIVTQFPEEFGDWGHRGWHSESPRDRGGSEARFATTATSAIHMDKAAREVWLDGHHTREHDTRSRLVTRFTLTWTDHENIAAAESLVQKFETEMCTGLGVAGENSAEFYSVCDRYRKEMARLMTSVCTAEKRSSAMISFIEARECCLDSREQFEKEYMSWAETARASRLRIHGLKSEFLGVCSSLMLKRFAIMKSLNGNGLMYAKTIEALRAQLIPPTHGEGEKVENAANEHHLRLYDALISLVESGTYYAQGEMMSSASLAR